MSHHKGPILMKVIFRIVLILMASGIFAGSVAVAQDYYKWVDEQGVTHYSEIQPADEVEHQTLTLPDQYAAPSNPEDDYYSIQNQLNRTLDRSEQIARQRPARTEPAPQLSRVEVIDNRGGFFVPNRLPNFSSYHNEQRFDNRQLQQRGGTRIGNQLRRQGIIPGNRQPSAQINRQGKRQSSLQRSKSGLISR